VFYQFQFWICFAKETLFIVPHLGQMISGLFVPKPGGIFIFSPHWQVK
jgi:hypothetical protein